MTVRWRASRWSLSGLVWLCSLALGLALTLWRPWDAVEMLAFDRMSVLSAPQVSVLPITIIGVDEASFAKVGKRWPWPRSLHATLVDRLVADGAAVIAFDMLFSEASDPAEDVALAAAIGRANNVVLASDQVYQETAMAREWLRVDPLPMFMGAGAVRGLTAVAIDGDAKIRRFPDTDDIFWRRVIEVLQRQRPGLVQSAALSSAPLIRHLGPAHTFPYVSYHDVINGTGGMKPGLFKDQIVLVGRDIKASPEAGAAQADLFATPFLGSSARLTPGVEIHATLIENALTGAAITHAGPAASLAAVLLLALLALPALVLWRPLRSSVWILMLPGLGLSLSYWLFVAQSTWLPVLAPCLTIVLMYVGMSSVSYLAEQGKVRQIKSAFSKYVAAEVVNRLIDRPDLLRLGGERRQLTLLFADLQGFTTLSEQSSPELVGRFVNTYLTAMTHVIMSHGGTVDKFIGDAVMAFWGAPLDDEQHASHAMQAAIAMQQKLEELQPLFIEMGLGRIIMRLGLHTGPALVGNMGSEDRFNYTAMGDTVNLAARLESVNKIYGTSILLSSDTVAAMSEPIGLRLVDRVRVQGKRQAVAVYTPCSDTTLIAATERASEPYRQGDWQQAQAQWTALHARYPSDTLAPVFLLRIQAFIALPPLAWDGALALDKG